MRVTPPHVGVNVVTQDSEFARTTCHLHFVAGTALCEPRSADFVAGAALVNLEVQISWQAQYFVNWPVCGANVVRERAFRSWTQKWPVCSANVGRERGFRGWTQKWTQKCLLLVCDRRCGEITSVMSLCHADLRGLGGKCVCVAPCHWAARNMLA